MMCLFACLSIFVVLFLLIVVFFCKQYTAYDMRISDWSSDVCSSDLRQVRRSDRILLGSLPILLLVVIYLFMAAQRHAANPADKILPLPGAMAESMFALMFQPDKLSGQLVFWADTLASLQRLGIGLGISTLMALMVGLALGVLPPVRATLGALVTGIAVIPPLALLPFRSEARRVGKECVSTCKSR